MKNTLMIALCTLGILASGCGNPYKGDLAALQGRWSGQEIGAKSQGSPSLIIEGAKLEFHGANSNEWYKATFTLREDTNPKQLEAVVTDSSVRRYVGTTSHSIYKIEDGKLTLTGNEPGNSAVPTSFDARGARQIMLTHQP
jgi:uncharacterized protein (TIGR03067 family)